MHCHVVSYWFTFGQSHSLSTKLTYLGSMDKLPKFYLGSVQSLESSKVGVRKVPKHFFLQPINKAHHSKTKFWIMNTNAQLINKNHTVIVYRLSHYYTLTVLPLDRLQIPALNSKHSITSGPQKKLYGLQTHNSDMNFHDWDLVKIITIYRHTVLTWTCMIEI